MSFKADPKAGFLAEAEVIEKRIESLGLEKSIRKQWELSGGPLEVTLGADIECYAYNLIKNKKISNFDRVSSYNWIEAIYGQCFPKLFGKPFADSNALEINLNPGKAKAIVQDYHSLSQEIGGISKKHAWDFAIGAGHWHLSLYDKGAGLSVPRRRKNQHLMNGRGDEPYSCFANKLAQNILALQCLCPALYFRPSRSDKNSVDVKHTKYISVSPGKEARWNTIQMDGKFYEAEQTEEEKTINKQKNLARMFEVRVANLAPEVPVLLMLHAVERTLKDEDIVLSDYNLKTVPLRVGSIFTRGRGTYFDYLRTTQESGYLEKHFPHLREGLIKESVLSYQTFLETPAWSAMYNHEQRYSTLDRYRQIYPEVDGVGHKAAIYPVRPSYHYTEPDLYQSFQKA